MHQSLQGATFHIEHIDPRKFGGLENDAENLAVACPSCNLHKSDRIRAADPQTGQSVRLFHPRRDSWQDHFQWQATTIVGRTAIGRATIGALDLNHSRRIQIREAEALFDLFPPGEEDVGDASHFDR